MVKTSEFPSGYPGGIVQLNRSVFVALSVAAALAGAGSAAAQSADRLGRLVVTVVDQTQAVLPDATVSVTAQREGAPVPPAKATTSKVGVAVFENLEPGRYTIQAEFPGFEPAAIRDVRVRPGDNRRTLILQLPRRDEAVTVTRDKQSVGDGSARARPSARSSRASRSSRCPTIPTRWKRC